jgi:hypothetical protein
MIGWAGATAQQASADETGAALGGAPWPKCEKSLGQQLLQRSNAQATLGRSPPRRLAQTTRIAALRRITTCQPCSPARGSARTRLPVCGRLCTAPSLAHSCRIVRLASRPAHDATNARIVLHPLSVCAFLSTNRRSRRSPISRSSAVPRTVPRRFFNNFAELVSGCFYWSERRDLNSGPLAPHGIHGCNSLQRFATRRVH